MLQAKNAAERTTDVSLPNLGHVDQIGFGRGWYLLLGMGLIACSAGCGLMANLLHAAKGNMIPAEYDGLRGRRVAVVCMADSLSYGPSAAATLIARRVSKLLDEGVKDVEVIPQQRVNDWFDQHDWNSFEAESLGNEVDADAVLVIDLMSFGLYEGQTLFKGRADMGLVVYTKDPVEAGAGKSEDEESFKWHVSFENEPPQIHFPHSTGITTTELSENEFRRRFIDVVAHRVARTFFPYDVQENFAQDTVVISR